VGFRDPLTTAEGVDTGDTTTGPGARIYQDVSGGWPRGVVEFRDGLPGDPPATLALTSYVYDDGTGLLQSFGNVLNLTGGGARGVTPASLEMAIEQGATGAYGASARLLGVEALRHQRAAYRASDPASGFYGTGWKDYGGEWGGPFVYLDAAGMVHVEGLASTTVSRVVNSGALVGTLQDPFRPSEALMFDVTANNAFARVDVRPTGAITVVIHPALSAGGFVNLTGVRFLCSTIRPAPGL
jgi:hypothetical protein